MPPPSSSTASSPVMMMMRTIKDENISTASNTFRGFLLCRLELLQVDWILSCQTKKDWMNVTLSEKHRSALTRGRSPFHDPLLIVLSRDKRLHRPALGGVQSHGLQSCFSRTNSFLLVKLSLSGWLRITELLQFQIQPTCMRRAIASSSSSVKKASGWKEQEQFESHAHPVRILC